MINFSNTPIPLVLVVAGITFLILSLGTRQPLQILEVALPQISDSQRWPARLIGIALLIAGFVLPQGGQRDPDSTTLIIDFVDAVEAAPETVTEPIAEFYQIKADFSGNEAIGVSAYQGQDSDLSEVEEAILEFISVVNLAETLSSTLSDPSYAALVEAEGRLEELTTAIETTRSAGMYIVPLFDVERSYYVDIRWIHENRIEVDGCEYWSDYYYDMETDELIGTEPLHLVPQTITIDYIPEDEMWFVTEVDFYDPPVFCD
jgi:hypothetical protein